MALRHFLFALQISAFVTTACLPSRTAGADLLGSDRDPALKSAVVNSEPGAGYGPEHRPFKGIPGIARAPDGRLWVTWYAGGTDEGPENYVALVSSGDDGRTWSEINTVIDPPGEVRAYDPVVWIDPMGELWWFYAQS